MDRADRSPTATDPARARPPGSGALSAFQVRRLRKGLGPPYHDLPDHSAFTAILQHGGLPLLLDQAAATRRIGSVLATTDGIGGTSVSADAVAQQLELATQNFFRKLVERPGYQVNADLISYITIPHDGQVFEDAPTVSADVPAVFTFVGQFIDHDLTMNAMDLFTDQTGPVRNGAAPLIDLDSVYGPRSTGTGAGLDMIFTNDGAFRLRPVATTAGFDLERTEMPPTPGQPARVPVPKVAHIFDNRNDENQLILQIHILLERVHNRLVRDDVLGTAGMARDDVIAKVRAEVVANWQTVVLQDYLPRVIEPQTLADVYAQIRAVRFGDLKYKPFVDLATGGLIVQLPHEWAIGFRFGHSQLRSRYHLNARDGAGVRLFDPYTEAVGIDDLRGGVDLPAAHVIDWAEFYPATPSADTLSMRIDGKVTPVVFNLPESAIPDNVKTVNNLPQRNLIRSRSIGVVSGEELYDFYTGPTGGPAVTLFGAKLVPDDIAPPDKQHLFMHDLAADGTPLFKTPLWYYVIKEAEAQGHDRTLGAVGSRLVAEVVAGAVFYDMDSVYFNPGYASAADPGGTNAAGMPTAAAWTSAITKGPSVTLRDLIAYATGP